jgi:Fe-S-cluster containining protein
MHPVCNGCDARCCVGRDVPIGEDEARRIAAVVGLEPARFSEPGADGGLRLRRRDGDGGACVFAVEIGGTRRCGIEDEKPRACRVYPYHVAVREDGAWAAALGNDAACPLPRDQAWAARVDDERETIEAAILEARGVPVRRLRVVDDSACFGCTTSCCFEYLVPVNAHDLWRLTRALGLPWRALAAVRTTPSDWMESFTLDAAGQRFAFHLHRRASGACVLLGSFGDDAHRCGAHAARPLACRVYPYVGEWAPFATIKLQADAVCPPPQRARYAEQAQACAPEVAGQVAERSLYLRVVARWDDAARTRPPAQPYAVDDYVRWAFSLYDALAALRTVGARGSGSAAAELIATFPLPDELAPGC